MAVTLSHVLEQLNNAVREDIVDNLEAQIDEKLTDINFLLGQRYGTREEGYHYILDLKGTLTNAEKLALTLLYNESGFTDVYVTNSEVEDKGTVTIKLGLPIDAE